jgi:hypothetical protein
MSRIQEVVLFGEAPEGMDPLAAELFSEAGGNRYGGKIILDSSRIRLVIIRELNPIKGRLEPIQHELPPEAVGIDPERFYLRDEYVWVEEKYFPRQAMIPLAGGIIPFTVIPSFPPDFLKWIKSNLSEIPIEHIHTSVIRFSEKGMEIFFTKTETTEMVSQRVEFEDKKERQKVLAEEKTEIAQYKKLHRKYGNRKNL